MGLGGALVGAALSFQGTVYQQKKLAGERRQEAEGTAAAALVGELIRMRQHLAAMPAEYDRGQARDRIAWVGLMTSARESEWHRGFEEIFAPAEAAARTLRNPILRERLLHVLTMLDNWWALNTVNPGAMTKRSMREMINHALEWLGAWQREDPIPEPDTSYLRTYELWQQTQDDRVLKKRRQG
ncbi:hypothetical protein ACF09C_30145 [Streptomyces sp. NPDC014870]|uniref:hypothetical protein n=1 Tax=Streptomyces sp. NPDC014870 TaxID=3364925 RepID=UPI0036F7454C